VYAPFSMPDILVRPVEERDDDGMHLVWSLTYNNGDPYPAERRKINPKGSQNYVTECDGQIAAACNVLDLTATRGDAVLKCGGVAAVAVLPEMRRGGVGTAMMSWLISHFRESGTSLASLYAFREPFYRKFGYEVAGKRYKITCPIHRWPKLKEVLPARRLIPGDWKALAPCYTAFSHRRSGMNIRTESQWQRVLGENRPLTIYAVGDPVEAYAVVSHVTNFWTTDHISEMIWSTQEGYESLLTVLGGLGINKTALSWFEPSDGPFYTDFLDQGVEVLLDRPIMYRVTDVPGCLRLLKPDPAKSGGFVIQIEDALVPDNNGPWALKFGKGVVEVDKSSLPPDLSMDIRHFNQGFLGEPGLPQLAATGRIKISSASAFNAACTLMPSQSTYCMDFF